MRRLIVVATLTVGLLGLGGFAHSQGAPTDVEGRFVECHQGTRHNSHNTTPCPVTTPRRTTTTRPVTTTTIKPTTTIGATTSTSSTTTTTTVATTVPASSSSTSSTTSPPTSSTSILTTTTSSSTSTTTSSTTSTTVPAPGGYPNAASTGVPGGVTLTAYTGPTTITTAGTVITGKTITGCLTIRAAGVVIRNSRLTGNCGYIIDSFGYSGTRFLIEDSEIVCANNRGTAIGEEHVYARRIEITACENGFDVGYLNQADMVIEDNYIHDLSQAADSHTDGIQITPTGHNVTIRHNTILVPNSTSAIIMPQASSGLSNITVDNNLMAGGAATIYCVQNGPGVNLRITNNRISRMFYPNGGFYYPWVECQDEAVVTGNVWHETGQPLP